MQKKDLLFDSNLLMQQHPSQWPQYITLSRRVSNVAENQRMRHKLEAERRLARFVVFLTRESSLALEPDPPSGLLGLTAYPSLFILGSNGYPTQGASTAYRRAPALVTH